jgi:hypothetical protein
VTDQLGDVLYGTPLADMTDMKVRLSSRGVQSSPRPAFLVMIGNARMRLFALSRRALIAE